MTIIRQSKIIINPKSTIYGIILILIHAVAMSVLYIVGKTMSHIIHPNQVSFLYKFSILLSIIPWCFQGRGIIANLKTDKIKLHFARSVFSIMAVICFHYGLSKIQVGDAAAITYLENAILVIIGIVYFKEKITKAKIILISCGFIGATFVIQPGLRQFNIYYAYLFLALIFWTLNNVSIKILGNTERTKAQVFYMAFFGSLISFPIAMQHEWPVFDISYIKFILILALFHMIHAIAFFKAFKLADISTVMPFDYTRLIFTGILGYFFLFEQPNLLSLIGYGLIAVGGIYAILSDGKNKGWARKKIKLLNNVIDNTKLIVKNRNQVVIQDSKNSSNSIYDAHTSSIYSNVKNMTEVQSNHLNDLNNVNNEDNKDKDNKDSKILLSNITNINHKTLNNDAVITIVN